MKTCFKCKIKKDSVEFSKNKGSRDGLQTYCKPCRAIYVATRARADAKANPEKFKLSTKARHLKAYNLTIDQYEAMIVSQDGCCKNQGCRTDKPGGVGRWNVDHDHKCCPRKKSCGKCIRGLLCSRCNTGAGLFDDDPAKLRAMADYLENAAAKQLHPLQLVLAQSDL